MIRLHAAVMEALLTGWAEIWRLCIISRDSACLTVDGISAPSPSYLFGKRMRCFRLGPVLNIQPKHTNPLREGPAEGLLLAGNHANTRCPVNRLAPAHKHNIIWQHARVERLREQERMVHPIAPDTHSH